MKKWFHQKRNKIGLWLLILAMFLIGCGGDVSDEVQETTEQISEEETEQIVSEQVSEEEQESEELQLADSPEEGGNLEIHFIDVGQGDCTLLICDGESMLIDAGNNDKGTYVQNYLQKKGITELKYVIGTHPDADHVGGLDVVLYKFDCDTIIMPEITNDTATYRDVLSAMESKQYQVTYPVVGDTYTLGGATFTIVAPNDDYGSNLNEWSVGVLVQNGDNRFLFTGDAEENSEADMLRNGIDLNADVYKVGHHGSNTATSETFLERVNPTYAVISVGDGNSYGHPNAEVLNRLREQGIKVFRTDEQGTLIATSDGTTITWNCSPSESWQAGEATGSSAESQTSTENGGTASSSVVSGASDDTSSSAGEEIASDVTTDATTDTVHITNTGKKYHKAGCRYLKDSDIEISYEEAIAQGYEPCKVCGGH